MADFACISRRVIIEVDGDAHARQSDADAARTEALRSRGFRVLRFSNREVLTARPAVQEAVLRALGGLPVESA